ncbi:zinc-binding dehydrogenase, partial [Klebsiella pneumoniae]
RGTYGTQADGWLTSYKVVDEESLVSVPDYLSWEQAATLPCAAVTAWNSLQQSRSVLPGETVLTQGTGGVSLFAVQFAKIMGARVIALTSNDVKAQLLSALGADHVIN